MMQKTYMSRAVSRAMSIDHPVGDPFGGPAYGEKNGPVAAIAIPLMGMAATGTAMMAGSIMAGVAFAGSALSLVGAVTGNKTLSQIGAVAGVIGGAGMAGLFGEGAKAATWSSLAGSADDVAGAAANAANAGKLSQTATPVVDGVETAAAIPSSAAPTTPVAGPAPGAGAPGTALEITTPGAAAGGGTGLKLPLSQGGGGVGLQAPTNLGTATAPLTMTNNATNPLSLLDEGASLGGVGLKAPGQTAAGMSLGTNMSRSPSAMDLLKSGDIFGAAKTAGSDFLKLAKDNPTGAKIIAETGGALGDWLSGKTDAELALMESRSDLWGAEKEKILYAIELEKQRRRNLNEGYQQVDQGIRVNPNAQIPQPWANRQPQQYVSQSQNPGLIQNAMVPQA